jgi:threonylcarbamoyladenosine tRNA methylthiotransferase MtaB
MTSFFLQNFGCRVNQAESFEWADELQRLGLRLEAHPFRSDLVVVNTCTLTARADRDARKFLARVGRENPAARVVVTGCLVERSRPELESLPNVTLVSNADKEGLVRRVLGADPPAEGPVPSRFRARGLLKVQDGCDAHCTFCVIPAVRGRSRSLDPATAVAKLGALRARGFREVVLTGIHLSAYGRDLTPPSSLLALLRALDKVPGRPWMRLSSLDPRTLDGELIEFLAASRLVRPHFHLSLQHGSDPVLARMGRRSRVDEYRRILLDLRRLSPEAGLGADLITGFPGESEDDFQAMVDFVKDSPLTYIHAFSYSPRPGTPAASWPGVDPAVVRRRTSRLRKLSLAKNRAFRCSLIGRTLEAVVIRTGGGRTELLTSNYLKVFAPAADRAVGEAVRVTLERDGDPAAWGPFRG